MKWEVRYFIAKIYADFISEKLLQTSFSLEDRRVLARQILLRNLTEFRLFLQNGFDIKFLKWLLLDDLEVSNTPNDYLIEQIYVLESKCMDFYYLKLADSDPSKYRNNLSTVMDQPKFLLSKKKFLRELGADAMEGLTAYMQQNMHPYFIRWFCQ